MIWRKILIEKLLDIINIDTNKNLTKLDSPKKIQIGQYISIEENKNKKHYLILDYSISSEDKKIKIFDPNNNETKEVVLNKDTMKLEKNKELLLQIKNKNNDLFKKLIIDNMNPKNKNKNKNKNLSIALFSLIITNIKMDENLKNFFSNPENKIQNSSKNEEFDLLKKKSGNTFFEILILTVIKNLISTGDIKIDENNIFLNPQKIILEFDRIFKIFNINPKQKEKKEVKKDPDEKYINKMVVLKPSDSKELDKRSFLILAVKNVKGKIYFKVFDFKTMKIIDIEFNEKTMKITENDGFTESIEDKSNKNRDLKSNNNFLIFKEETSKMKSFYNFLNLNKNINPKIKQLFDNPESFLNKFHNQSKKIKEFENKTGKNISSIIGEEFVINLISKGLIIEDGNNTILNTNQIEIELKKLENLINELEKFQLEEDKKEFERKNRQQEEENSYQLTAGMSYIPKKI
jgi:hypothetical protein